MFVMNHPTTATHLSIGSSRGLERALLVVVLLASAVAISPNRADPDLWGHVAYGRDALRDGLPAASTYTFTAPGYRWINHENLAELALAISADTVGPRGMLVLKCLLGMIALGLIFLHARRQQVSLLSSCAVLLLVAVNLSYFWALRPQLASFVLYALLMTLLSWCFRGLGRRLLAARLASQRGRCRAAVLRQQAALVVVGARTVVHLDQLARRVRRGIRDLCRLPWSARNRGLRGAAGPSLGAVLPAGHDDPGCRPGHIDQSLRSAAPSLVAGIVERPAAGDSRMEPAGFDVNADDPALADHSDLARRIVVDTPSARCDPPGHPVGHLASVAVARAACAVLCHRLRFLDGAAF
jgi:hypothetical protein